MLFTIDTDTPGCNFHDTFIRRESLVKGIPVITADAEESNVSIIGGLRSVWFRASIATRFDSASWHVWTSRLCIAPVERATAVIGSGNTGKYSGHVSPNQRLPSFSELFPLVPSETSSFSATVASFSSCFPRSTGYLLQFLPSVSAETFSPSLISLVSLGMNKFCTYVLSQAIWNSRGPRGNPSLKFLWEFFFFYFSNFYSYWRKFRTFHFVHVML